MRPADRRRMALLYRQRKNLREAVTRTPTPAPEIRARIEATNMQLVQLHRRVQA